MELQGRGFVTGVALMARLLVCEHRAFGLVAFGSSQMARQDVGGERECELASAKLIAET